MTDLRTLAEAAECQPDECRVDETRAHVLGEVADWARERLPDAAERD